MDEDAIKLEMDYTTWALSCRTPAVTPDGQLIECRRPGGHEDDHAVRNGPGLIVWGS